MLESRSVQTAAICSVLAGPGLAVLKRGAYEIARSARGAYPTASRSCAAVPDQREGIPGYLGTEIIDRANVGRATFYAHYDNKEDLLESGFDGLLTTLRERQREARSHGRTIDECLFAFSHHLLTHADEHRDIFPAMVSNRGGAFIQHLLRKSVGESRTRGR
jgi:hypothetical protein